MKILCTGVCGFIGTHLRERLEKEGHEVIGLDNLMHPCKYHNKDFIHEDISHILDIDDLFKDCDFIIHLAAQIHVERSIANPRETAIINFLGTLEVLELGRKYDIPVLFASSTEIYGDRMSDSMDESHVMNPKSRYAACKLVDDG